MTVSLDAALSGLRAAQAALDVASTNISNASTPGYTRKIIPQETLIVAGEVRGVQMTGLVRHVDNTLISDLNRQISLAEGYNIRQKYFDRIQDFHGASDAGRSLSTQLTALNNSFTQLSSAPNDDTLIQGVITNARQMAFKINNFAETLTTIRQGVESDIARAVQEINTALENIATANLQIQKMTAAGQSTASLEDSRDLAIKTVAKYIDINTYNDSRGAKMVITRQGEPLADHEAHLLYFQQGNASPIAYYPGGGLSGLRINSASGDDITNTNLGGQLGAMFEMRDTIIPRYTAQIDEFAQKLADRFDNAGLRLFTDLNGAVPMNQPDPLLTGYSGFATLIQVNDAILDDPDLIRNGTTGNTETSGSNEVIRRVLQFTFGVYESQVATGNVDISAGALLATLGLTVPNGVSGTVNIGAAAPDLSILGLTPPVAFTIDIGGNLQNITINPGDTAATLVSTINTAFGTTNTAALDSSGQLVIRGSADITLADVDAGTLAALGLTAGLTPMPSATFKVQVGTRDPVTISINSTDTSVELLTALNAVPGLTASLTGAGFLQMSPTDGGDITILDTRSTPLSAMGVTLQNISPFAFRQDNLGPDGTVSTELLANSSLQDYIASIISSQGEDANSNETYQQQEATYMQTLETRSSNFTGVNIDQEMADLIRIQSAYAAAARMITATKDMFETLIGTIR